MNKSFSSKGGLITFIKTNFKVNKLDIFDNSDFFEAQFFELEINDNEKIAIGNVWRSPYDYSSSVKNFIDEFKPLLNLLNDKYSKIIISGDFNINLLSCDTNRYFNMFLDLMFTNSMIPSITLPTRFDQNRKSATLIDNIFVKTK